MPPEHARQIEEEFGIRLPSRYLEYVRNFPHIIEEMAYDPERWREHIENGEFLADPDELIRLNREFRNWHCEDEDGATVDPAQYWAIGGNYGGD